MVNATLRSTAPAATATQDETTQAAGVEMKTEGSVTEVVAEKVTTSTPPAEDFDSALGLQDGPPAPTGAVVPAAPRAVSRFVAESDGTLDGEWGIRDIKFPAVRIVAGSGELVQRFTSGTTIFGDDELLAPPKPKNPDPKAFFRFIPMRLQRGLRENLTKEQQEAGIAPRYFKTDAEALAAGLTTVWVGKQKPTASPTAACLLLIERPEGSEHPGFALEYDGKPCALAVYYAGGTAFNAFAKLIFSTMHTTLLEAQKGPDGQILRDGRGSPVRKPCIFKNWWTFKTAPKTFGDFTVICPEIKLTSSLVSDEIREFLRGILSTQGEEI